MLPKQVVTLGTRNVGELICSVSNDRLDLLPIPQSMSESHISERPAALVVPRGAVYIEGDRRFVYRVEENRLHRRLIKVGIANPTKIEVLSGLSEGDARWRCPGRFQSAVIQHHSGAPGMMLPLSIRKRRGAGFVLWIERGAGLCGTEFSGRCTTRL